MRKRNEGYLFRLVDKHHFRAAGAGHIDFTGRAAHGKCCQLRGFKSCQRIEGPHRMFTILIPARDGALRGAIGQRRDISIQRLVSAGAMQMAKHRFQSHAMIDKRVLEFAREAVVLGLCAAGQRGDPSDRFAGRGLECRFFGAVIARSCNRRPGGQAGDRNRDGESKRFSPHIHFPRRLNLSGTSHVLCFASRGLWLNRGTKAAIGVASDERCVTLRHHLL